MGHTELSLQSAERVIAIVERLGKFIKIMGLSEPRLLFITAKVQSKYFLIRLISCSKCPPPADRHAFAKFIDSFSDSCLWQVVLKLQCHVLVLQWFGLWWPVKCDRRQTDANCSITVTVSRPTVG